MAEEVDHELGFHQEFVPQEHREARVNTCKDGKEMCFEGVNGALDSISVVDIRRNQLVGGVPVFFDDVVEFLAGLIVQDVAVHAETLFL